MVLLKALVVNLPTTQQNDEEEKEKYQLQFGPGELQSMRQSCFADARKQ
jgi:hypothetical protein